MQAPKFDKFKKYFNRKKPSINEMVRELTAGGIVFRRNRKTKGIEILLIQDPKGRWSIPKGISKRERRLKRQRCVRLPKRRVFIRLEAICWLGKTHFRYRRVDTLVLMTTQVYLVKALGDTIRFAKKNFMLRSSGFRFRKHLT